MNHILLIGKRSVVPDAVACSNTEGLDAMIPHMKSFRSEIYTVLKAHNSIASELYSEQVRASSIIVRRGVSEGPLALDDPPAHLFQNLISWSNFESPRRSVVRSLHQLQFRIWACQSKRVSVVEHQHVLWVRLR
jgi:hypothetical protein